MGDFSQSVDVEKLISYSDDLVECLRGKRDIDSLTQCLEHSSALQSSCDADFGEVQSLVQEYQKKIDACKQKTDEAKSDAATDAEINFLEKELEGELQREQMLREELRTIIYEINDLEHQRVSVEERNQIVKKLKQDDQQAESKLSMYASVTNIIPSLDDELKISGHIVERNKKVVEKFEFDPAKLSVFDTCNRIWKMIDK
ncbi:kinetochore protein SPC24 homolog [Vitis riparia]|uniref:kinetochore protein SPC24 homolog n=1 Tax=Vitis riparia TaxID=96939 RepID=UPI00155B000E|nr:kinetochore protein SPC24 homolog [Vitis riparia]